MALSNTQKMVLTGIAAGTVMGIVIGVIGAYFNLPAGVRGGLIGGMMVPVLFYLRKQQQKDASSGVDSPR
jgi:F0F1-type ATP synthase assembly protein I